MSGPTVVRQYEHSRLVEAFQDHIKKTNSDSEPKIAILESFLTDLDNDGANDDVGGTAILKMGRRFKSFIFLMREDGAIRLLENSGKPLDPNSGGRLLSCGTKQIACPDTLERARSQISGASIQVAEYDKQKTGLELIIQFRDGLFGILNSLELFAN